MEGKEILPLWDPAMRGCPHRQQGLCTIALQEIVPVQWIEAMICAFGAAPHELALGLMRIHRKKLEQPRRAALQALGPRLYAFAALAKLLTALASSSWTSKTV